MLVVGLTGAVYTASTLIRSQDIPSAGAWKGLTPLNVVLVSTGVVTLIFGYVLAWGYGRTLRKQDKTIDLDDACKSAWHLAIRELRIPGAEMDRLGVNVWTVRGFRGARFLERRARFTLQPRKATRVTWRKGTGAIGIAWAKNRALVANVESLELRAHNEEAFCALDKESRYGLSWQEFEKARHYRAILAIPLETRPDHVAGVLSLDLRLDGYADDLDTLSGQDQLSIIRDVCERALGGRI